MNIYEETKFIMKKYNVHANKKLGQNFLFDEQALDTIANEVTTEDTIIEIGPGLGTLTAILLQKAKGNSSRIGSKHGRNYIWKIQNVWQHWNNKWRHT